MSDWVAGVDGCRRGWAVVLRHQGTGEVRARVLDFTAILRAPEQPSVIAVDMPIGLPGVAQRGGRAAEVEGRRLLPGRSSSLFSAPTRAALEAFRAGAAYAHVSAANRGGVANAPGLSKQTFHLLPKIDEVDRALSPALQRRVREVHPELSFALASHGATLPLSKKTAEGRAQRARLLVRLGFPAPLRLLGARLPAGVSADDLLDACIACWTAGRIAAGAAEVFPPAPEVDARGLRMELWR